MRTIMIDTYVGRTQGMLRRSASVLALTVVAACSRETLLEVETPDQISPGDAANPAGAQALRAAATMIGRVEELGRGLDRELGSPLRIGIGIHAGRSIGIVG